MAPDDYPRFMFTSVYTSQWRESKVEFTLQHLSIYGLFNIAVCSSDFILLIIELLLNNDGQMVQKEAGPP